MLQVLLLFIFICDNNDGDDMICFLVTNDGVNVDHALQYDFKEEVAIHINIKSISISIILLYRCHCNRYQLYQPNVS